MSYSDLEHFPFDERSEPEGHVRPSGATRAPQPNESAPPASRDAKIFRDDRGVTWWVHEVNGEYLGTVGATCLLVVSAKELRRVWKFPGDWRSLSAEELLRLPQQPPPATASAPANGTYTTSGGSVTLTDAQDGSQLNGTVGGGTLTITGDIGLGTPITLVFKR